MLTIWRPNILQQAIPLREPIKRIVALPHAPYESRQRIRDVLASVVTQVVYFSDRDLNRCVVLCFDDAVGGAALAGDVEVDDFS